MAKTIPQHPALSDVADDDLLLIEDMSAGATKKITRKDFVTGMLVQEAIAQFFDSDTGTTIIPKDNTLPHNTEGDEYMTIDFTPRFSDSTIEIEVVVVGGYSTTDDLIAALFKDSDANALAAGIQSGAANAGRSLKLTLSEASASTAQRTYKVRVGGAAAGTFTFNGASGTRLFGAIPKSYIKVSEFAG